MGPRIGTSFSTRMDFFRSEHGNPEDWGFRRWAGKPAISPPFGIFEGAKGYLWHIPAMVCICLPAAPVHVLSLGRRPNQIVYRDDVDIMLTWFGANPVIVMGIRTPHSLYRVRRLTELFAPRVALRQFLIETSALTIGHFPHIVIYWTSAPPKRSYICAADIRSVGRERHIKAPGEILIYHTADSHELPRSPGETPIQTCCEATGICLLGKVVGRAFPHKICMTN